MIGEMVLTAFGAVSAVMFALWLIHLRTKNAGVVDIGWAGNFALVAVIYFFMSDGFALRKILIAGMVLFWSLRLTAYLFVRVTGEAEDGRYQHLRQKWGGNIDLKFLVFFLFQGVLNLLLSIPLLVAMNNPAPQISMLEYLGIGIWIIALLGESLADRQLQRFKADPRNWGKVCQTGLWRFSRHPNYFFEWLIWIALFVFAMASPYGLLAAVCPLLMLYFLFKVTGIPATEEQSLRSKGEAYRNYQRTTSPFFPWFPRKLDEQNMAVT